jgi:hypothetical protein
MASTRSRERVARNFVRRYGRERLRELLGLLSSGESGQAIAEAFDVSRERVRQWKNTFGTVVTLYQVHAEVEALLVEPDQGSARSSRASSSSP